MNSAESEEERKKKLAEVGRRELQKLRKKKPANKEKTNVYVSKETSSSKGTQKPKSLTPTNGNSEPRDQASRTTDTSSQYTFTNSTTPTTASIPTNPTISSIPTSTSPIPTIPITPITTASTKTVNHVTVSTPENPAISSIITNPPSTTTSILTNPTTTASSIPKNSITTASSITTNPTITTSIPKNPSTTSTKTVKDNQLQIKTVPQKTSEENYSSPRDTIQLHMTVTEAMKKVKILEETNKGLVNEKISIENQLKDLEDKFQRQKGQISDLEKKLQKIEEEKNRETEKNRQLQKEIRDMTIKHTSDMLPLKEKDAAIKKLTTDLTELREKYSTESRIQQQEIITSITKTETLQLEKANLDKDKERLLKEKSELGTLLTNLQKQVHLLSEEKDRLEAKIDSEHKKNRQLEAHLGPLEKKLQERETAIQHLTSQYARENEEKIGYIKKLEGDIRSLLEEREFLVTKVNTGEKILRAKIDQIQKEGSEILQKYQNQSKTIERLLLQNRNVMFQLANEVKRNGNLVKENSELKQTIQVQNQIIANLGIRPPPIHEQSQYRNGNVSKIDGTNHVTLPAIEHPPTMHVQTHAHVTPTQAHNSAAITTDILNKDNFPSSATTGSDSNDVVVIQSGSWLSSVPLFGSILSPPKTFRKKFEVIV